VHRSNLMLDYAYGENFQYSEMMLMPGRIAATLTTGGLGMFAGTLVLSPTRTIMKKFILPKPGDGPNKRQRETGFYHVIFIGKTEDGRLIRASVKGDRDPGYGSTSKMLGEAAVCMAQDISKVEVAGGILTSASAMGSKLINRLQNNAGLAFDLIA